MTRPDDLSHFGGRLRYMLWGRKSDHARPVVPQTVLGVCVQVAITVVLVLISLIAPDAGWTVIAGIVGCFLVWVVIVLGLGRWNHPGMAGRELARRAVQAVVLFVSALACIAVLNAVAG